MIKCKEGKTSMAGRMSSIKGDFATLTRCMTGMFPRNEVFTLFLIGMLNSEISETAYGDEEKVYGEYDKIKEFIETSESSLIKYIRNTSDRDVQVRKGLREDSHGF